MDIFPGKFSILSEHSLESKSKFFMTMTMLSVSYDYAEKKEQFCKKKFWNFQNF